ncbi:MAG: DUF1573 domain-containing protein [Isosphaeraceae bacterium]|jgi:hypothetical protein
MTTATDEMNFGAPTEVRSGGEKQSMERIYGLSTVGAALISFNLTLLGCLAWGVASTGSVSGALRFLKGDTLIADRYTKSFGSLEIGRYFVVSFKLVNLGRNAVRVVGCRTTCNCIPDTHSELPFVIEPNRTKQFGVLVSTGGEEKEFKGAVILLTNNRQRELNLSIEGTVVGRRPDTSSR